MSETHKKLTWDGTGERFYETGVNHGVLYIPNASGQYIKGVAWNGLTSVSSTPDGAEATDLWADNSKYATFRAAESYGGTITAYTYPDEWAACDGYGVPDGLNGVRIGQQKRATFGFCYRTEKSNDIGVEGYILHLVYGATASPSEQTHDTVNDNPDAVEFSWDFETTPAAIGNVLGDSGKPTSYIELDSLVLGKTKMEAIEDVLYGSASADARLPLPSEVVSILNSAA